MREVELGNPRLEALCCVQELYKTRDGKPRLLEEKYFELL
jgi:hypothetical protein